MKDPVISHAKHFSDADSKGKPKQKPCPAAKDRKLSLEGGDFIGEGVSQPVAGKGDFCVFFVYDRATPMAQGSWGR
jgi:hypothetical protein